MAIGTKRDPAVILLLTFLTCGLYYIWWVYETSREIDAFLEESDVPPLVHAILMIVTGSLWGYVWDLMTARRIVRMQEKVGLPAKDNSIVYLALDVLGAGPIAGLGIVSALIQQSDLNAIYRAAH